MPHAVSLSGTGTVSAVFILVSPGPKPQNTNAGLFASPSLSDSLTAQASALVSLFSLSSQVRDAMVSIPGAASMQSLPCCLQPLTVPCSGHFLASMPRQRWYRLI